MEEKMHRWIEIISVRLFSPGNGEVVRGIFSEVISGTGAGDGEVPAAELFLNDSFETDWAVYLYRSRSDGFPSKTPIGLNIAEVFRSLGLVNHSVWKMDSNNREVGYA